MTVINIETVPERKTANKAPGKTKSEEKTTKGVSLSDNSDDQDKVPLLHYGDDQWEARKELYETTQDEFMEMLKYKEDKRRGRYAIEPQIPKYDHPWSGKLKMTIADSAEFIDCKTYVLEDRIGEILVALYEASYPSRLQRIQEEELLRQEIERLDKEIEEDKRREQIRDKYNSEVSKTKALINKATDYETACSIRKLIGAVKKDPNNPDNNPEWIDWANKKADWFDPTIAREDELFGIREHDLDPDQKALKER